MKLLSSRSCEVCKGPASLLTGVRWQRRDFCGHACAATVRDAHLKAHLDSLDSSPIVCRCSGAPDPLEPIGPHCARCRRMFSAEMRLWLTRRSRRHGALGMRPFARWLEELAWQLGLRST
jgi:hypothetical protein